MILRLAKWHLFAALYGDMGQPRQWLLINSDGPWFRDGTLRAPLQFTFDSWNEAWDALWRGNLAELLEQ